MVRNDEASWEELAQLRRSTTSSSRPGPAGPTARRTSASAPRRSREAEVPLLGVCLGHQGLGWVSGGAGRARARGDARPAQRGAARGSRRCSPGSRGSSRSSATTRCASQQPLPEELEPIAWTSDGVVMGVAHTQAAAVGRAVPPRVDLHRVRPQAAGELPRPDRRAPARARRDRAAATARRGERTPRRATGAPSARALTLRVKRLDTLVDAERAFVHLFGEARARLLARQQHASTRLRASRSWATPGGPLSASSPTTSARASCASTAAASVETFEESIFDYLSREMRAAALPRPTTCRSTSTAASSATSATS